MKFIIFTKEQADNIRGNYGKYSELDPIRGNWRIYLGLSDELVVSSLAYNDGAAASVEYTIVSSRSTEAILQFRRLSEYANSYIEIDEVQLIEQ